MPAVRNGRPGFRLRVFFRMKGFFAFRGAVSDISDRMYKAGNRIQQSEVRIHSGGLRRNGYVG